MPFSGPEPPGWKVGLRQYALEQALRGSVVAENRDAEDAALGGVPAEVQAERELKDGGGRVCRSGYRVGATAMASAHHKVVAGIVRVETRGRFAGAMKLFWPVLASRLGQSSDRKKGPCASAGMACP